MVIRALRFRATCHETEISNQLLFVRKKCNGSWSDARAWFKNQVQRSSNTFLLTELSAHTMTIFVFGSHPKKCHLGAGNPGKNSLITS